MRLDKLISNCGFGSRKEVKIIMKKGLVTVDGVVCKRPETHVNPECQRVCIGDTLIEYEKFSYLMLNKPAGVISATFDEEHETVVELLEERYLYAQVFPVGRLDKDTTGLLILSNDGGFAHRACSPKKRIAKVYEATLDKNVSEVEIKAFADGVTFTDDDYKTMPATLEPMGENAARITVFEGKFHQIKRMFEAVGFKVLTLKRVSFAGIKLDESLAEGEYRRLNDAEMDIISNLISKD